MKKHNNRNANPFSVPKAPGSIVPQALTPSKYVKFSYQYTMFDDDLCNLHSVKDTKWFVQLLKRKKELSCLSDYEIKKSGKATRCHPIKWENTSKKQGFSFLNLGEDIVGYQFSLSQANGRVIGFFLENIFHIVWFDPDHNLYPEKDH